MGLFDDIVNKATPAPWAAPATPLVPSSTSITGETFQQTLEKSKLEEKGPGLLASIGNFVSKAPKAIYDWVGTQKDHIFDNEDEKLGITDWKKYKQYEYNTQAQIYSPQQAQEEARKLFDTGVVTEKYFTEQQKQYDAQPKSYSSAQELQQKITRDLTSQVAPYLAQVQDVNQRRTLTQAIETQTKTFMDYYNRIAESHDSFDKDKQFAELSSFMDKSKKFLNDFSEEVVQGSNNKQAYLEAQKKNIWLVKEMDKWNSNLTTKSLWASFTWAGKDIADFQWIQETVGDIFGLVTGGIALASNATWRTMTENPLGPISLMNKVKQNISWLPGKQYDFNSGLEELYLDAGVTPNDAFLTAGIKNMRQGFGEVIDGFDTLAQAAIPMAVGGGVGLLGKVERWARLAEWASLAAKALPYARTVWVGMMQDAFVFDASFTAFQRRGLNSEELAENAIFSIGSNAVFIAAFARPVLKGAPEFRELLSVLWQDSRIFAHGEWLQAALNSGNVKQADHLLKKNISDYSSNLWALAWEVSEKDFLDWLTDTGKKNYVRMIQDNNRGIKSLMDDPTSDIAFTFQQKMSKASSSLWLPSEAKLAKQDEIQRTLATEAVSNPALSAKHSFAAMNDSPAVRTLLSDALNKTQIDSGQVLQPGSPFFITNEVKEGLLNKLLEAKAGVITPSTPIESYLIIKTLENLHDQIKLLDAETLRKIKRDPDLRLPSELTSSVPVEPKKAPSFEEIDKSILPEEPKTHTEFTQKAIDAPLDSQKTVESFLPADDPGFLEQFKTRINKAFANSESGVLDITAIKSEIDAIAGKTVLWEDQTNALTLYYVGKLFDDFAQIKAVELVRDITDKTLFTSHPFFKLLWENGKALVNIKDPRDLENMLGQLFLKSPKENLYSLPVMKYVIKDEKFKEALVKRFVNITSKISTEDSAADVWGLVEHMFMRAGDIKFLEGQKPAVLDRYIDLYVKQQPIIEGAKYAKWVEDITTTSPNSYQSAAIAFNKQISELVDNEPIFLNKERLKFSLLAQGLDEITSLQAIDEWAKLFLYARSNVVDLLAKKNDLNLEKELLLPDDPRVLKIDEELVDINTQINEYSRNISPKNPTDNMNQVLERVSKNEIFKGTYTEAVTALPSYSRLLWSNDIGTVAFDEARHALLKDIAGTNLNHTDYEAIVQFLHIPNGPLNKGGSWREEYLSILSSIQSGESKRLNTFVAGYIYEQYSKSIKNFEKAIDNVRDSLVRHEKRQAGFIELKNPQYTSLTKIPSGSYIVVWHNSNDPLKASKINVESSESVRYHTLFEMDEFVQEWFTAPVFITRNALANLRDSYMRKPSSVAKDIEVLRKLKDRIQVIDIDLSKPSKSNVISYVKRGYDDINTLSAAINENSLLFSPATKKLIKSNIKTISETYGVAAMSWPADFARIENVLDAVIENPNTQILWRKLKEQIPATEKFDIFPFMQGKDFPEAYQKHLERILDIYPGAKEFPWFLDAFKFTESEFHDYSMLYALSKRTNKNFLDNIDQLSSKVKQSFIEKLVGEKSTAAQKYATYKILDFLKNNGYVVPEMTSRELLSLVDDFAIETSAIIGRVAKDVLFESTLTQKAFKDGKMQAWISEIEQALKYEWSLDELRGSWGLQWDVVLSKIEWAEDVFGSSVDDAGDFISPDFTYIGPKKLEDLDDEIGFFQTLWSKISADITDVTKNVYLWKNFVPYQNTERDLSKLLASDFNQSVRNAWEQVASDTPPPFRDANIYTLDPSLIQKDKDSHFYIFNGEKTVLLKTKQQARDELMFAIWRAAKKWEGNNDIAFRFYATPKDSPIKLSKEGDFITDTATYIDPKETPGHSAFLSGADDINRSPLFQWAFADEIARQEPVYNIIRSWTIRRRSWIVNRRATLESGGSQYSEFKALASATYDRWFEARLENVDKEILSVLKNYENFMWFKDKTRVIQSWAYIDYLWEFSPSSYRELSDSLPAGDVVSVRAIGYLPTADVYDETGELIHSDVVANKYMFEWDGDKELHNFFSQEDLNFGQLTEKFDLTTPPEEIIEVTMRDGTIKRYRSFDGEIDISSEISAAEFKSIGWDNVSSTIFSRSANKGKEQPRMEAEIAGKKYSYIFDTKPADADTAVYRQVWETVTNLETGKKFQIGSDELANDFLRSHFKKEQDLLDSASDFNC